jgi:DNA-binding transcriptional ArsR family regulator
MAQWFISKDIRTLIAKPAQRGERSEADYSVCLSLVYAGATNDDILAVFEHNSIGKDGKFAEDGPRYLARTIGRARAFAEANPRPDVPATIELLRLWIRTHSFAEHVPTSPDGIYRTDATDTKIADAICDAMLEDNRLDIVIGKKRLGKLAGAGCNTAERALGRLNGWLFTVTPDKFGARVALVEKCRFHSLDPSLSVLSVTTRDPSSEYDKITGVINEYSPRKADDAFLAGTSRHVKQQMKDVATALDITDREALEQFTFKGFGESGLRVIDAMLRVGDDMTTQELADETGKKQSAIRLACSRLVQHGLLEATREGSRGAKVYSLADNVWERLAAVAPHLRTYKLSAQRENKRLECAQAWTKVEIAKAEAAGDTEQAVKLERRFAKQAKTRITHLESLYPDLSIDDIERLAYEVAAWKRSEKTQQAITTERTEQRDEHRANISMIRELAYEFTKEFADAGLKRPTLRMIKTKIMQFGVFDETTVGSVLWSQKQMSQYEAVRA